MLCSLFLEVLSNLFPDGAPLQEKETKVGGLVRVGHGFAPAIVAPKHGDVADGRHLDGGEDQQCCHGGLREVGEHLGEVETPTSVLQAILWMGGLKTFAPICVKPYC